MTVTIQDDFDLGKIADSGQCFRACQYADGAWRFITGRHLLRIRQTGAGRYAVNCTDTVWQRVWAPYFDLPRDYAALRAALPAQDTYLCAAAAAGTGMRILRQDPWEMLVSFIISQRKSIPAIKSCIDALCRRYGQPLRGGAEYAFPTPRRLAHATAQELAECGLGYRAPYVHAAAQAVDGGSLDLAALDALCDEALLQRLQTVHGVGIKVANCVALFGYGRMECAPVDVWIARVISQQYGGQNPFPAYRNAGILQQYMFCYARQNGR